MQQQQAFKTSKPSFLVFTLVFIALLVFYLSSSDPIYTRLGLSTAKVLHAEEYGELVRVLKNATTEDRTVILTTLNEAWATPGSVLDLFLESFRIGEGTKKLLNHLVIVAMDQKSFDRCKSIHPHCFRLTTPGVDFTEEKRFMTPDYLKLMWRRIEFLRAILELGYSFVFTDADIMWLRDPFQYFEAGSELTIACDFYNGDPKDKGNKANGGFNYVRSDERSIEFYKYWYMARVIYPNSHDQAVFDIIKHEEIVAMTGYEIRYLDTAYFGGFCQPSMDMNKVITMHANCCVGLEKKIHDLRLILEDWKNFTALPDNEKKLRGSSSNVSPWRAPSKCKVWP